MKIKFDKWIIFKESEKEEVTYILDFKDEKTNDDEISLCIQEQIYGDKLGVKQNE